MSKVSLLFLLFLTLTATIAWGASEEEETQKLNALQQSLETEQSKLREMRTELDTYPDKLTSAREEVVQAEDELEAAQQELTELQEGDAGEREVSLQEHAVQMAERRVRSENRMLERYQRYRDELEDDISEAEAGITQLEQRMAAQRERVAEAREESSQPETAGQSAQPTEQPSEPEPPEQSARPTLSSADYEAFQVAKDTMARVDGLVEEAGETSVYYRNLELTGSSIETVPFEHLGANQYRAEAVLPSGRQRFAADSLRFRINVSTDNAGKVFVFIADGRDRGQLRIQYFKKELLDYLGRDPVVENPETESSDDRVEVTLDSGETVKLNEDDAYALEIATEHQATLEQLAPRENPGDPVFAELTLEGGRLETTRFDYLGKGHYQAEVEVDSGRQFVEVNRSTFRVVIPDRDAGEPYLFFVDASRPNNLRLTYYKKAVLDYLGKL